MPLRRPLPRIVMLGLTFLVTTGFVTEFRTGATLPATVDQPEVTFYWNGSTPNLTGKGDFRDGIFADTPDSEVMLQLLEEAAATWSDIPGSFLKIQIAAAESDVTIDPADEVNVIATISTNSLSSAATAAPQPDGEQKFIVDCDIQVDPNTADVKFLLYALVHELGHCLGLGHAHDNYHSIMGYSRTPNSATLGADDKAGAVFLYPDPAYADPTVEPTIPLQCGVVPGNSSSSFNFFALILFILPLACAGILHRRPPRTKPLTRCTTT